MNCPNCEASIENLDIIKGECKVCGCNSKNNKRDSLAIRCYNGFTEELLREIIGCSDEMMSEILGELTYHECKSITDVYETCDYIGYYEYVFFKLDY